MVRLDGHTLDHTHVLETFIFTKLLDDSISQILVLEGVQIEYVFSFHCTILVLCVKMR